MTNADRIRDMTDDELCKFLDLLEEGVISYVTAFYDMDSYKSWKCWLSSDANTYGGINNFPWFKKLGEQE